MGTALSVNYVCCNCKKEEITEEPEDLTYSAPISDEFLLTLERDFNLLTKIDIEEYILLLYQFNQSGKLVSDSTSIDSTKSVSEYEINEFNEPLTEEYLNSFIENKILSNDIFYNYKIDNNDKTIEIFKEFIIEMYRSLKKKFKPYSDDKYSIIKKSHCLALGLIYCQGKKRRKMDIFYKFLKDKKDELCKGPKLNKFLITLLLIPSCCIVSTRIKLGIKYNSELGEINKKQMMSIIDLFDTHDIEKLIIFFNKNFFVKSDNIEFEKFKEIFDKNEFDWIFNPSGVRATLEKISSGKVRNKLEIIEESKGENDSFV